MMERIVLAIVPALISLLGKIVDKKRIKREKPLLGRKLNGIVRSIVQEDELFLSIIYQVDTPSTLIVEPPKDRDGLEKGYVLVISNIENIKFYENS